MRYKSKTHLVNEVYLGGGRDQTLPVGEGSGRTIRMNTVVLMRAVLVEFVEIILQI